MNDRLSQIWRAPAPPGDLAARTLDRWQRIRAHRRRRLTGLAALAAVAAVLVMLWSPPRPESAGVVAARERTSVDLAGRVAAVAEAGAALRWRAEAPAVAVDQRRGRVFYRVERGERARVDTPAGTVAAEGSCFSVEVQPMKSEILSAAGGAAVAIAVVVVYQGAVTAESEQGAVTAGAGERVSLSGGSAKLASDSAPIAAAPASASREELLARDRLLVKRVVALQNQVGQLETRLASPQGDGDSEELSDDKFFDLSDDELALLADRCEIRYDIPGWGLSRNLGPHLDRMFEDSDLPEHEQAIVKEVMATGDPELLRVIRELYIEVTGDRAGADTISPRNLQHEVFEKSRPGDLSEALRRISAERAGRAEPPADLASRPAVERLLRALVASGAVLEQRLAAQLGAERARELREAGVGYGRRRQSGCPDAE